MNCIDQPLRSAYLLVLGLFLIGLTSCEKLTIQTTDPDKAVVKGYLFAGHLASVNITKPLLYGSTDTTLHPIEGLLATIYSGSGEAFPLTYTGNGNYQSNQLVVKVGETYTIKFEYKGKEISSSTTVPQKPINFSGTSSIQVKPFGTTSGPPSMNRAEYTWSNPNSSYFLMVVENIEAKPTPINDTTKYDAFPLFRQSPTQGSSHSLMGRSFYYYGRHHVILYSINKDYVDLYEDTGNNSQNITNPPGNISNGLGIFTAINADTLNLTVTP